MSLATLPLVPKSASGELSVIAIGRISTVHQDVENIEASYRFIRHYLDRLYQGPIKLKLLGEQASGMLTDRATIREAEEQIATGTVDLVIAEDLARIYRNPRFQYDFVQNAVDTGTRVICIGDNLDTADENWEIAMGAAALRHGLHIPDTRRRVRRTATHSFHKGGMVGKFRYGYRKLSADEAKDGNYGPPNLRIAKRPECTPVIRAMVARVMRGDHYAAIADWLNAEGVEPGAYVTGRRWTARLVVDLLLDPILSGTRTFRDTLYQPVFRTGRHKPAKNPQPETEHHPELAHLDNAEHRAVCQAILRRSADVRRPASSRQGIPRSRSVWPGQSATCAICGGLMYYAGRHLKCSNSLGRRGGRCWNRVQVPAGLVRARVIAWLVGHANGSESFRQSLVDAVWQLLETAGGRRSDRPGEVARQICSLEKQAANLAAAIATGGQLRSLVERLGTVEAKLDKARAVLATPRPMEGTDCLASKRELAAKLPETLLSLAGRSFEFADLLRRLLPEFVIQPVQALDTPLVRPRGKLKIQRHALGDASGDDTCGVLEVALDFFEPPAHIRAAPACRQARGEYPDFSLDKLAALLKLHRMTVKRALDYSRLMERAGVDAPYRELTARPSSASRWRTRTIRSRPTIAMSAAD